MHFSRMLIPGARQLRVYGDRLIKGISSNQFARKPMVEGKIVEINHPAFVFGHLSLYPVQLATMLGLPTDGLTVPESYPSLFKVGSPCHDDPDGTLYPSMDELVAKLFAATDGLLEILPDADPARLEVELEDAGRRERFGTVGPFVAYILLAHPGTHFGQISGWRRCMGLGPA